MERALNASLGSMDRRVARNVTKTAKAAHHTLTVVNVSLVSTALIVGRSVQGTVLPVRRKLGAPAVNLDTKALRVRRNVFCVDLEPAVDRQMDIVLKHAKMDTHQPNAIENVMLNVKLVFVITKTYARDARLAVMVSVTFTAVIIAQTLHVNGSLGNVLKGVSTTCSATFATKPAQTRVDPSAI